MPYEFPYDPRFDIDKRDPNQTLDAWLDEIMSKGTFERAQIPTACYEKMYSAQETIDHMMQNKMSPRGPGRPPKKRNAEYVKRRLADLVWRDCSTMLGQARLLPDGRELAIEMQKWAEANGSRFKSIPKG